MKEQYIPLSTPSDLSESALAQALFELADWTVYVSSTDLDWAKDHFKGKVVHDPELLPFEWYVKVSDSGKSVGSTL